MTSLKDREGVTDRAKKEMETKIDDWVSRAYRQLCIRRGYFVRTFFVG